ncbi:MAG: DapH/DapD/GlmU-related protein [Candidatus Jordarchaeaceae archaeon]
MVNKIPQWVEVGEEAKIDSHVIFKPWKGEKTIIGKRAKIDAGAVIYGGVRIGNDTIIGHNSVIRFGTVIGVHSVIGNLTMLEGNIVIGEHTLVHSNNHIGQKTKIGNYVFMAPFCVTTNDPEMYYYRKEYSKEEGKHWQLLDGPTISDGARIAAGVILFPKVIIGKQAVVGAGAVVTKNVPDFTIVFGNPATIKGFVNPTADQIVPCPKKHA